MSRDQLLAALRAERLNTDWWPAPEPAPAPTRAELSQARTEDLLFMAAAGVGFTEAAQRVPADPNSPWSRGMHPDTLERWMHRNGLSPTVAKLRHQDPTNPHRSTAA